MFLRCNLAPQWTCAYTLDDTPITRSNASRLNGMSALTGPLPATMSASIIRRSIRSLPSLRRHVATTAAESDLAASQISSTRSELQQPPPKPRSRANLPPEKMRALISLYHQSENFITPENLSAAIDAAFIDRVRARDNVEASLEELEAVVGAQRRKPKVGTGSDSGVDMRSLENKQAKDYGLEDRDDLWSQRRPRRHNAVMSALFGTVGGYKPDLDVLDDEYERIVERLQEEQKKGGR